MKFKLKSALKGVIEHLNDHHGFYMIALTIITLWLGFQQFGDIRRPFIVANVNYKLENNKLDLYAEVTNYGTYPGVVKEKKVDISIGGHILHVKVDRLRRVVIPPKSSLPNNFHFAISDDYNLLKNEVISNKYGAKQIIIDLELVSKSIWDKDYKYSTPGKYSLDITGQVPRITIIDEPGL